MRINQKRSGVMIKLKDLSSKFTKLANILSSTFPSISKFKITFDAKGQSPQSTDGSSLTQAPAACLRSHIN